MKGLYRNFKAFALGAGYACLSSAPVWADDTDAFLGISTDQKTPNVLFILDNSESMKNVVPDSGGKTRFEVMQTGLTGLIESLPDMNIQLMTYNAPGAYIMGATGAKSFGTDLKTVEISVWGSEDDAYELDPSDGGDGTVYVDPVLVHNTHSHDEYIPDMPVNRTFDQSDIRVKHQLPIRDVYQNLTCHYAGALAFDVNNYVGLQFRNTDQNDGTTNIGLDKDDLVLDSTVHFTPTADPPGGSRYMRVKAENTSNASNIADGGGCETIDGWAGDIYSTKERYNENPTATRIQYDMEWWDEVPLGTPQNRYYSYDLSNIYRELVTRGDWSNNGGYQQTLLFKPEQKSLPYWSGHRSSSNADRKPRLLQRWVDFDDRADSIRSIVGLRFRNINIPAGSLIQSASIEVTPSQSSKPGVTSTFRITMQQGYDTQSFTTTNGNISSRPTMGSAVAWTAGDWTENNSVNTPDLKDLMQDLVDLAGYCSGDASPVFFVEEITDNAAGGDYAGHHIQAYSSSQHRSKHGSAAKLKVSYYEPDPNNDACGNRVSNSIVEERYDDWYENELGTPFPNDVETYFRQGYWHSFYFRSPDVPNASEVLDARFTMFAKQWEQISDWKDIRIRAELQTDPARYNLWNLGASKISNRTKTSAYVDWHIEPGWILYERIESPDITDVIQEVVNQPGFDETKPINIILETVGNHHALDQWNAYTTDGSLSERWSNVFSPQLFIRYKGSGSEPPDIDWQYAESLIDLINDLEPEIDSSPIADALYEASQYYRGGDVTKGKRRPENDYVASEDWANNNFHVDSTSEGTADANDRAQYYRVSGEGSWSGGGDVTLGRSADLDGNLVANCTPTSLNDNDCVDEYVPNGATYDTPIEACQRSHIVLITDGEATDNTSVAQIAALGGMSACTETDDKQCTVALTDWMATKDQMSALDGAKNVYTHVIGIDPTDTDATYLKALATAGLGTYQEAENVGDIMAAVYDVSDDAIDFTGQFSSPAVTVNQFNRLSHLDQIYFGLFNAQSSAKWHGNLKRYRLEENQIVDATGAPAVDQATEQFYDSAQSYWSTTADGNVVAIGGAAEQIPSSRTVYFYNGSQETLSNPNNAFSTSNVSKDDLGIGSASDDYHDDLVDWVNGIDVLNADGDGSTTDVRTQMGDPLHSQPAVVTYDTPASGDPEMVIFIGTNEGYLHAIDSETGEEKFAFIPTELFGNLNTFYQDPNGIDHPYGIDGSITAWVDDGGDGDIDAGAGDHVYIYFGFRRGGQVYYALDVTDLDNPKVMWKIDASSPGFAELGQSWSQPVHTQIDDDGDVKDVLIFGGGYDDALDVETTRDAADHTMGRAMYVVEAGPTTNNPKTPDIVWSVDNSNTASMEYAIPSTVRIVDYNTDGLADFFYVGDMGGQLWRFDINNGNTPLITGGIIGEFASDGSEADNRHFYNIPDVSLLSGEDEPTVAVALGSGWRANPLERGVTNRFYMVKQPLTKPETYTKLTESDLYNATANTIQDGATETDRNNAKLALKAKEGWYVTMGEAEKVLSDSVTINNNVVFTTYTPDIPDGACPISSGDANYYIMDIADATAPVEQTDINDNTAELDIDDRSETLEALAIPPSPNVLIDEGGQIRIAIGAAGLSDDCVGDKGLCYCNENPSECWGEPNQSTFWYTE